MSVNRLQVIEYITDMSKQMNKMALNTHSPLLALLLEMAAKEGSDIIKEAKKKNRNNRQQATHNHQSVE